MILTRTLAAALLLSVALGSAARAEDEATVTPEVEAQVRALLEPQGYEIRSVGMEDGRIEVYAVKDGAMLEMYLDDQLNIVEGGDSDEAEG